jgi:integrase/recombinase XerD
MRQQGLSAGACNAYARTLNSFLSWLHEEGHIPAPLRVRMLPNPPKPLTTFSDAEVLTILSLKPKGETLMRAWTLVLTLIDTGVRIEEALTLERAAMDFDALHFRVLGKGNKERVVPFSHELRKVLYRHVSRGDGRFVFGTRNGSRMMYRNAYRDIKRVCAACGIEGERVHPHAFRHFFAVNYLRRTNDIYRLSRILGHTSVTTTQLYLRSMPPEQVAEGHCSPLSRVR